MVVTWIRDYKTVETFLVPTFCNNRSHVRNSIITLLLPQSLLVGCNYFVRKIRVLTRILKDKEGSKCINNNKNEGTIVMYFHIAFTFHKNVCLSLPHDSLRLLWDLLYWSTNSTCKDYDNESNFVYNPPPLGFLVFDV